MSDSRYLCSLWSVCAGYTSELSVQRTAALIVSRFGQTRAGLMNHVLYGGLDPHGKGQYWGVSGPLKTKHHNS